MIFSHLNVLLIFLNADACDYHTVYVSSQLHFFTEFDLLGQTVNKLNGFTKLQPTTLCPQNLC